MRRSCFPFLKNGSPLVTDWRFCVGREERFNSRSVWRGVCLGGFGEVVHRFFDEERQ